MTIFRIIRKGLSIGLSMEDDTVLKGGLFGDLDRIIMYFRGEYTVYMEDYPVS